MSNRRPLGTGPTRTADPADTTPRARLAAELATDHPAPAPAAGAGHPQQTGGRTLGKGPAGQ
ncbi:hypothetical protein [Streptomyces candidus]|uniref:Uncharacterized protein n=1 Tax=Streptomyces candidus TaxID=67283 RepID=A0A7X0LUJ7_9ACTN|nr:hypothetical protein [Streptomyces candidus]MBB6440176.1 hypothetical protein [Streptomyces candidus]GHH57660.1 hypothetical protein GCM10018773_65270 [Streptomyces candidus]